MEKKYYLVINGQKVTVPDPVIISHKALKESGRIEKATGIFIAYDSKTHAGGILLTIEDETRFWNLKVPISLDRFTAEVKLVVEGILGPTRKFH